MGDTRIICSARSFTPGKFYRLKCFPRYLEDRHWTDENAVGHYVGATETKNEGMFKLCHLRTPAKIAFKAIKRFKEDQCPGICSREQALDYDPPLSSISKKSPSPVEAEEDSIPGCTGPLCLACQEIESNKDNPQPVEILRYLGLPGDADADTVSKSYWQNQDIALKACQLSARMAQDSVDIHLFAEMKRELKLAYGKYLRSLYPNGFSE